MTGPTLTHKTVESGHVRISPASEIGADVLEWLRPIMVEALADDACHPLLDSGWWLRCSTAGGRIPDPRDSRSRRKADRHAGLHSRHRIGTSVLKSSIAGVVTLDPELWIEAAEESGNLTRSLPGRG